MLTLNILQCQGACEYTIHCTPLFACSFIRQEHMAIRDICPCMYTLHAVSMYHACHAMPMPCHAPMPILPRKPAIPGIRSS